MSGPFSFEQSGPPPPDDRRTVTLNRSDLERALSRAVREGLADALRHAASDENVKKFWHRGFQELSSHSGAKVRDGVGGWAIKWGSGILAAAGLALWLKFGPWK